MLKRIRIVLSLLLCLTVLLTSCANAQTGSDTQSTASEEITTAQNQTASYDDSDIIGNWYSAENGSVFAFDADGTFRLYSLTAGYFEYSDCYIGTYSYDGVTLTTVFSEQTDRLPCTYENKDGDRHLLITFETEVISFTFVEDPPSEHPVYSYPDFAAIAQTMDVEVPECTGLEIETELVGQIHAKIATDCIADNPMKTGVVAKDDVVLFSFRGYKIIDGEQEDFNGGTAQNQTTVAGDGNGYVPGFGKGLIGRSTEEDSFDVEVTFPNDYTEASLAGQTVYFEMKIHGIYPEITDEMVMAATDGTYPTYADYFAARLSAALKSNYTVLNLIPQIDFDSAGGVPEEAYLYFLQSYLDSVHRTASNYGLSFETLLSYYGQTEAEFLEEATRRAMEEAQTQLSIQFYFRALHLEITDDLSEKYREELISLYLSEYTVSRDVIEDYLNKNPDEVDDFVTMQTLLDYLIQENTFIAVKEAADL